MIADFCIDRPYVCHLSNALAPTVPKTLVPTSSQMHWPQLCSRCTELDVVPNAIAGFFLDILP